jgi:hypothetical protein
VTLMRDLGRRSRTALTLLAIAIAILTLAA